LNLEDLEAIKRVQHTFLRAADTRDGDLIRTTVIDDFYCDTGSGGRGETRGIEAFVTRITTTPAIAVHHALMPEIDFTAPDEATGIWAVHMFAKVASGQVVHGFGHYTNTYARIDGAWRLTTLRLTWLHRETQGGEPVAG
jgi:hypothetical protein